MDTLNSLPVEFSPASAWQIRLSSIMLAAENRTIFILVYHEMNTSIIEEWDLYKSMLQQKNDLFEITGIELVTSADDPIFLKYYRDRYTI